MDDIFVLFAADEPADVNIIAEMVNDLAHPLNVVPNEQRRVIPKSENFYETTIPSYPNDVFKEHFRMSRAAFNALLQIIIDSAPELAARSVIPIGKKLLFAIWLIAKPESFLAAGDRFGIARSTAHSVFTEIITVLCNLLPRYVTWPEDTNTIEAAFRIKHGFPGIVGAIDGSHIEIKQPIHNSNDYYNRNGYHSIILQGICDHNLTFLDVFIGFPGRVHDARVFRNSVIHEHIHQLPHKLHILGDSAYPLAVNVMSPFRDNGHLNDVQLNYNSVHSKARAAIERAFARLKGKFRRLKYLDIGNPEFGTRIIAAACVLHNFIIQVDGIEDEDYEPEVPIIHEDADEEPGANRNLALDKRARLADILMQI